MTQPLVTIAVPVYNGARHLRESLDSILGQTYPRTEVIVLDDASTDETPAITASYGARIRLVRNSKNLGGFGNMNAGIRLATGSLFAIYHADDVYEPTIVEREVAFLESHPKLGAVFCLDTFIDGDGREYGRLRLPHEIATKDVLTYDDVLNTLLRRKNRFLRAPGAMFRRQMFDEIGLFREQFGIASDLDMWLRIARYSGIGLLHEYLFHYRHFHGNWSQQYQYLRTETDAFFRVVDAWLASGERPHATPDALAAYEGHRAEEQLMNAVAYYIRGDMADARRLTGSVNPGSIARGGTINRPRIMALWAAMGILSRLPRIGAVSDAFHRRWYARTAPTKS
jgi:glycosyltransferase involved in cell wall biosynthesis